MPAQGHHSSTRTANVAKQKLHYGSCTDDLHTLRLLRPTYSIAQSRSTFATRVLDQCLNNLHPLLAWHSAHLLHHFGSIACIVATHDLEDTARMLQCGISHRLPVGITLVVPAVLIGIRS